MDNQRIVKFCKDLGCCDACCLRYLEIRNPTSYENVHQVVQKYQDSQLDGSKDITLNESVTTDQVEDVTNSSHNNDNLGDVTAPDEASDEPPAKRVRLDNVCVSCLGILQEETWPECFTMVQELLDKKCYECDTIACALSSPIATIIRERDVVLRLQDAFPDYELKSVAPLKEVWKWMFGRGLAAHVRKQLESGAVAPLLVTLTLQYAAERAELNALLPGGGPVSRRAAELALAARRHAAGPARPAGAARPAAVAATHAPVFLGGRYVKLSRELPQTPWFVAGERVLGSSVQELIVAPLASAYGLTEAEAAAQIKFMAAGREDVDVRCLGTGRPFALEVADPRRLPAAAELRRACDLIAAGGDVRVDELVPVAREELALLKKGEETKSKTYEALCVKLAGGAVTARELGALNAWGRGGGALLQRTPLRVLHRRALRARARRVLACVARGVPGAPALFALRLRAEAGTYVKEWAHGELGRTRPALRDVLGAPADILALDVAHVDLPWPPPPPPAHDLHDLHDSPH